MKNIIKTVCTLALVGSAVAQTSVSLIDEDFTGGTISGNARIRTNQSDGTFYTDNNPNTDWTIANGVLSNAGVTLGGGQTEGAISQVIDTSALATDLSVLTLSFDYEVGATATLKFALIGYTLNVQDGQSETDTLLMNNGTSNGSLQNNTQGELRHGDINLLTGADMTQGITNDLTFASGTSGSHSVTIDLTSYAWHADEAVDAVPANTPGLSGSIASIADFDYVVLVAVNDLSSDLGVTATTLDNMMLTVAPLATATWDGETDSNWATNTNWVDDILPASFDRLIFTGTANTATNNDLAAGTFFNGISFTNTADTESFLLAGNSITLGGNITQSSAASGSITDTISLDMELNGDRTVNSDTDHNLEISGIISEDGSPRGLTKSGAGVLTLSGVNTYSGSTVLLDGTTLFTNSSAFGTSAISARNTSSLEFGADGLDLTGNLQIQNSAGLRTMQLDLAGTNTGTLSGELDIRRSAAGEFVINVGDADTLTLSGRIYSGAAGGAGITKVGDGTLVISNTNNSYLGNTTVSAGTLSLGDGSLDTLLDDSFDVIVETGAVLNLNFTETDTIRSLFVGGVQVDAGTYSMSDFPEITGAGFLEVTTGPVVTVPSICAIEVDGSGNVILTLDGPVAGLTVQQSNELTTGSFVDVASTPGADTFTVDAALVDPNADGTDFYRVRN